MIKVEAAPVKPSFDMAGESGAAELPPQLTSGVPMLKVSSKKIKPVIVTLSPTTITWPSLKGGKVEIRNIRELRLGVSPTDQYDGARWITIVYVRDKQWKVVHFIAHTDDIYALWSDTLNDLVSAASDRVVSGMQHGPAADPDLLFIKQLWPTGATKIDARTATSLCHSLGLSVGPTHLANYQFPLDMGNFRRLVREVQTRPELGELFQALGGDMTRDKAREFLRDVQKEELTDEQFNLLYDRFADAKTDLWTSEALSSYLASPDNVPKAVQDLGHPLPEYFIASSHNTYLVAGQWRGDSTVEGYIRVLLDGCRSVEIDVHNGETEPVVYHGNTMTSSVPILDVCQAIKKYAFVASPYPVILSLEVRCSVPQQERLAKTIKDVFGDLLVTEPLDYIDGIPSPEDLKGRVLVKSKAAVQPTPVRSVTLSSSPTSDSLSDSTTTESDSSFVKLAKRLTLAGGEKPKSPKIGIHRSLSDLPIYTAGVKYQGFSKLVTYESNHMFSVSERTAQKILRDGQQADWVKHNFSHLSRVYPKAVRLTSSNFDPRPFWQIGAQMVAINYQTFDEGSLWNHAMFHDGGYVLKPLALRQKTAEVSVEYRVRIRIISAQRLPPTDEMYVEATIGDDEQETRELKEGSLSPRWDQTLEFTVSSLPSCLSLVFVKLAIKGSRGTIAQWCRPLTTAGRGFRYLPLEDNSRSRYLFATLFVRISYEPIDKPTHTRALSNSLSAKLSSLRPVSPLLRPASPGRLPASPLLPAPVNRSPVPVSTTLPPSISPQSPPKISPQSPPHLSPQSPPKLSPQSPPKLTTQSRMQAPSIPPFAPFSPMSPMPSTPTINFAPPSNPVPIPPPTKQP
ncbi:PLC-like phosphodiesterase [Cutaneotrichosporon oleaginosum]|uniref:Phosphoinositide phospholipase C n=2 Tax=Cutaneotrichosporon oleaginosum TaxID=879819 RepID=A0A0J0XBM8_9TREE|nr:PLC-like phosphodiesterase [Cutaneotrichosporon oleaginosum]KLT38471.1 PLC-like phosphodiesterase [Cutaneotrichosporon oleaginosum]